MGVEDKVIGNTEKERENISEKYNKRRQRMAEMLYNGETNRSLALGCMVMYAFIGK